MSFGSQVATFDRIKSNWPGAYLLFGQFMSSNDATLASGDDVPEQVAPGMNVTWEEDGRYVVTLDATVPHVIGVFCACGAGQEGVAMTLEVEYISTETGTTKAELRLYEEDGVSGIKTLSDTDNVPCWFVFVCSDYQAPGKLDSLLVEEEGVA